MNFKDFFFLFHKSSKKNNLISKKKKKKKKKKHCVFNRDMKLSTPVVFVFGSKIIIKEILSVLHSFC